MPCEIEDLPLPGGPYIRIDRPEVTAGPRLSIRSGGRIRWPIPAHQLVAPELDVADRLALHLLADSAPAAPARRRNIPTATAHPARGPCRHRSADSPSRCRLVACSVPVASIRRWLREMSISSWVSGTGRQMRRAMHPRPGQVGAEHRLQQDVAHHDRADAGFVSVRGLGGACTPGRLRNRIDLHVHVSCPFVTGFRRIASGLVNRETCQPLRQEGGKKIEDRHRRQRQAHRELAEVQLFQSGVAARTAGRGATRDA
jgi:hypothetical protein